MATFGNEFDYIRNSLLAEKVPSSSAVMVVVVVVVEDRQKQRWSNQKQISTLLMILIGTYSIDHVQSTVLQPQFVAIFPS